jgi:hypothetical protein
MVAKQLQMSRAGGTSSVLSQRQECLDRRRNNRHPCTPHPPSSYRHNKQKQHSPSPKSAHRLPNRRNDSVLPQRRARLEAAGNGGSPGRDRAEDTGCHRGGFVGNAQLCEWVLGGQVSWVSGRVAQVTLFGSSPHPSKLETRLVSGVGPWAIM